MSGRLGLIGREAELGALSEYLDAAFAGNGRCVIVSGQPGIGKSRLVAEAVAMAGEKGLRICSGAALADSARPFQCFAGALSELGGADLFSEEESAGFLKVFAVDSAGELVAESESGEGLASEVFAGTLAAVQRFMRDTFEGDADATLGRLEFGDLKMLTERGERLMLTAIVSGQESESMSRSLRQALRGLEGGEGAPAGSVVKEAVDALASETFLVKRSLEGLDLQRERTRIATAVLELLGQGSGNGLFLVLEDLHWADEGSLFVLGFLARSAGSERVLILATARPGEGPAFEQALEEMRRDGVVNELELGRLGPDDVASLVSAAYSPNDFPGDFSEVLAERSGGNPFFVVETLRHAEETGQITYEGGRFGLTGAGFTIPESVEDVVRRRLDCLDVQAFALAEFLSCVGAPFPPAIAHGVGSVPEPEEELERLVRSGILLRLNGHLDFGHAILRDVTCSGISGRWRAQHHLAIGEWYEREFARDLDSVLYELARHFNLSRQRDKALDYSVLAGEKAEAGFAPEQAMGFYRNALDAMDALAATPVPRRLGLMERLADLRTLTGDYDGAMGLYREVLAATGGETKARMHRRIGIILTNKGEYEGALATLEEGREALAGAEGAELGRLLNSMAEAHKELGQYDLCIQMNERALAIFEASPGLERDVADALNLLGNGHWRKGDYSEALECYDRALELDMRLGRLREQGVVYTNMGNVHGDRGDIAKCSECYERGLEIFEKVGDLRATAIISNNLGIVYTDTGDFDRALASLGRSLGIYERIGDVRLMCSTMNNIGNVHYYLGDYRTALDRYLMAVEVQGSRLKTIPISGVSLNNIGCLYLELGDTEKSMEYQERAIELAEETGSKGLLTAGLISLSNVHIRTGELGEASEAAERGLGLAREMGLKDSEGDALRNLGAIAARSGDEGLARERFARAVEMLSAPGLTASLAETRLEHGRALKLLGDAEGAFTELKLASELYESLGMAHKAGEARAELEGA